MIYFYLSVTVISVTLFITDMVLMYMEKIKSFGLEKKLFKIEFKIIPLEKFLPENLTMIFVFFVILGGSGVFFELVNLTWFFSLPCSVFSGLLICFAVQYHIKHALDRVRKKVLPSGDSAAGANGWVVEEISADSYGVVRFEYKDSEFNVPAVSVNGTLIPEFEKIVVLFEESGFYFVESIKEVYDE